MCGVLQQSHCMDISTSTYLCSQWSVFCCNLCLPVMMLQGYHECRFCNYMVGMHRVDCCSHAWPEEYVCKRLPVVCSTTSAVALGAWVSCHMIRCSVLFRGACHVTEQVFHLCTRFKKMLLDLLTIQVQRQSSHTTQVQTSKDKL